MNKAEVGEVSDVFEFDNSYVVAILTKENKEGYKPIEDIENIIKEEIKAEKKYEILLARTENYSNLEDLSEIYNTTIVKDISGKLSSLSVNNLGYVPEVLGAVYGTEVGDISNPIKAQNSLIFVRVTARDQYRGEGDFSAEQKSMTDKIKNYSLQHPSRHYKTMQA